MEDEVDIRHYILVLGRHWRIILGVVVAAVIVTVVVGFLLPVTYEAKASVLVTKTRTEIMFEPNYKTVLSEEDQDLKEALVALVRSDTVAAGAVDQLGDILLPSERNILRIQKKVSVRAEGDLIEIVVNSGEPDKAAAIANAWAQSYVTHVNGLYTGTVLSPEELRLQAEEAKQVYFLKQREWEAFVSTSRLDELERLIADKELLVDVKSLRDQIAAGVSSPASSVAGSLAIVLLEAQAFAPLPNDLQLALDSLVELDADAADQLSDVDALISTLAARSGGQPGDSVEQLRAEILQLQGEYEQESALEKEMQRARDVAWETYTTLDNKANELEVAAQAQDVTVRVAVSAAVPQEATARPSVTSVGVAIVLALIVGAAVAFVAEQWGISSRRDSGVASQDEAEEPKADREGV